MEIRIYNTLTKTYERVEPSEPGTIKIYVCGATVYDLPHIGHLRHEIIFDTFVRFLEWAGYNVRYVQNITDIDDKIIERAKELGIPPSELALRMTIEYFKVMDAARVGRPWLAPKATDYIERMVSFIDKLIERGYAYVSDGDVYFSVKKFDGYGKLSGQSLDALKLGARVEAWEKKQSPEDFALWKSAKEGEPSWPSPWGRGRPGWHIECSVMSHDTLGTTLDIHGGGTDLIFPHHENEIAQTEAALDKPLAKYWMHHGMVNIRGEKMSKSLRNVVYARDILDRYGADVVRFYVLRTHYRAPMEFDFADLDNVSNNVEKLSRKILYLGKVASSQGELEGIVEDSKKSFESYMSDDFNTPRAIGELIKCTDLLYESAVSGSIPSKKAYEGLLELWNILNIFAGKEFVQLKEERAGLGMVGFMESKSRELALIDTLIEVREEERKHGNYRTADWIRARLLELGVIVEDTSSGPRWYYAQL
ncbi:MAG: cysteine--tRNA ligase [Candidatus Bathyarchaeia archaeon]